ncbi:MICAL-like protein 1 isoform X1 [Nematostella vectensis]|uniref:MICAL-like protein 1 isoform X1 n=1 Tax=Nematostella vectensis TaxID=45351 RepID=UPI00207758C2|nr:MICAL-like protein 1 isoform X1 [Nematostella vectensis]
MPEYRSIEEKPGGFDQEAITRELSMHAASGPRALLLWSRQQTEGYKDVNVYNMTTSWRDGLAFCAIIHRYRPDLIDFEKLSKENIVENNTLAFSICDRHFEIPALLDVADMVECTAPDKLTVISYVSQLFNYFKDKTPANQNVSTKMSAVPSKVKPDPVSGGKPSKRVSPYALGGRAKRISSALKNVFRSESKDEHQAKAIKEAMAKQASLESLRAVQEEKPEDTIAPMMQCMPSLGTACLICGERVYLMERLVAERRLFHRACFRCSRCNSSLRAGTYTFFPESESFCCLYECMGIARNKQDNIKIQLQPITDNALRMAETLNARTAESARSRSSTGTTGSRPGEESPQKQFSVVKKTSISIGALPLKSFAEVTPRPRRHGRQGRRSGRRGHDRSRSNKEKEDSSESRRKRIVPEKFEVKRESGKVKSSILIKPSNPVNSPKNVDNESLSSSNGSSNNNDSGKAGLRKIATLNDAYNREEDERPQQGGVQMLLSKFKNIDDMIESKHKKNISKKNELIKREIESVLPSWRQANTIDTRKKRPPNLPKLTTDERCNQDRSDEGKSGHESDAESSSSSDLSSTCHSSRGRDVISSRPINNDRSNTQQLDRMETTQSKDRPPAESDRKRSWDKQPSPRIGRKNQQQLTIPSDSSSSPSTSPQPARRNIPIIVRPSDGDSNSEPSIDKQDSSRGSEPPPSPLSSQPSPKRWSSQNSLGENSSTSSSPRMSIIIAQEPSMTKINSRYFTVETCQSTGQEGDVIMEECEDSETMQIEGEFSFGKEFSKFNKAQKEALKTLRKMKVTREKSDQVKEEEVSLSQEEMTAELKALETLNYDLELRGVEMEKLLRHSMESDHPLDNEDEILREWLTLIHEKNVILRRESELIYLMQFHQYEERYWAVECELRGLVSMRDEVKSSDDVRRERDLLAELLNLVQKRSFIVDSLEEDRIREKQEDENIKHVLEDGLNEAPVDSWEQKPDYTKVAFSRFYC